MLSVVNTVRDLRAALLAWREAGDTVGFVPTMGALHRGHIALVEQARKATKRVVASIFVNPLQFGPQEDLAKYPRQLEADRKMLADAGCDLLFTPTPEEMYPNGAVTKIDPGPLTGMLEGAFRPGHFTGVATVVVKLLLQVMPDAAFFGEKDYQQLLVIRRIVQDLNIPVHIVGVPTVRDTDGLALSSRNAYLSPEDRQRAGALPRVMQETIAHILEGADIEKTLKAGQEKLRQAGFSSVDYLELADATGLSPLRAMNTPARLLAAARMGSTRLIDNMAVDRP
ncbi:MAG: pantoate--beta-alanine ligase [Alphaproteobacteria bacterium]|nr:pantoate--beta-alanine ligase [Alphaproteobacteria bacterium]